MSKAIGKVLGAGGADTSMYGSEQEILKYLNGLNTSNVDNSLSNLSQAGYDLSTTLGNRPDYVYAVDGSDTARQRTENAVYNSAIEKMQPQFDRQQQRLETRLQNQGLAVGSEAYQRAMNDLYEQQNDSLRQAAYESVSQGQQAFNSSLQNAIAAGNFSNQARALPINEILTLISGSPSRYDVEMDKYAVQSGADRRIAQNRFYNNQAQTSAGNSFLSGAAQGLALFSDARLKENKVAVGKLNNGLTVYLFNYAGSAVPHIGLIAQEVVLTRPEAVCVDEESGYLKVNYAKACR